MASVNFETIERSAARGAEIRGSDLREPLDGETGSALRAVWLENLVLVFRGQDLNEEDQARFAGYFGNPSPTQAPDKRSAKHNPDSRVLLITNIREDGKPIGFLPDGELQFHSDSAFLDHPLMATVLYAVEIPTHGGNTLFANTYMAFASLQPEMKSRLENHKGHNVYDFTTQIKTGKLNRTGLPHAVHPVIRIHPETGGKGIYVNRLMTEEIDKMAPEESQAVLSQLFETIERSEFIYEHVWQKGDLVIWDNRCAQHARRDFPADQRRLMRRIGIEGDAPF